MVEFGSEVERQGNIFCVHGCYFDLLLGDCIHGGGYSIDIQSSLNYELTLVSSKETFLIDEECALELIFFSLDIQSADISKAIMSYNNRYRFSTID